MRDSKQSVDMNYTLNITICALRQIFFGGWVNWDWSMFQLRNVECIKNLVGKFERKKCHERLRYRREDYIKTVLREGHKVCLILCFPISLCVSCSRLHHFVRLIYWPCVWWSCLYWPWLLKNITVMEFNVRVYNSVILFQFCSLLSKRSLLCTYTLISSPDQNKCQL